MKHICIKKRFNLEKCIKNFNHGIAKKVSLGFYCLYMLLATRSTETHNAYREKQINSLSHRLWLFLNVNSIMHSFVYSPQKNVQQSLLSSSSFDRLCRWNWITVSKRGKNLITARAFRDNFDILWWKDKWGNDAGTVSLCKLITSCIISPHYYLHSTDSRGIFIYKIFAKLEKNCQRCARKTGNFFFFRRSCK